jgi:putative ABC transport system permease protein
MLFSLVVRNLWARRIRSLLTILGIGISIAVIIALFVLATNFREKLGVTAQITQADLVATQRGLAAFTGGSIPESDIKAIAEYQGVEQATGFLMATISLPEIASFPLFGVIPEDRNLYVDEQQIIEGRYIQKRGEIALGKLARDSLGLQEGGMLKLESGEELNVVCIYQTGNVYLDSGGIIPLAEAQEIVGREGKVTLIAIYLMPGADKDQVVEQIESRWHYLKVVPSAYLLETSSTTDLGNTLAWVVSVIAVIMGCIGVVNTMLLSVSERTREIGIMKTIGWSGSKILRMIFSESLLLSLVGSGIGSLLGMSIIWVVTSLPSVKGFISPSFGSDAFLIGLAVALILGILGGAFAAYRAFRLSPVEALRHE